MLKNKWCRYIGLSAPLFVLCLQVGCGGDETEEMSPSSNVNQNTSASMTVYTEAKTPATVKAGAMHGLEVPSLDAGNINAFIIHTLPDGPLNYCCGYNTQLRLSAWTAYKWYNGFSSNIQNWKRKNWSQGETFNGYGGSGDPFQPDPVLPADLRTYYSDYSIRGYQRGHLLGSADRLSSKEANGQTFYLSNVHPQLAGFNNNDGRSIWFRLEIHLRDYYDISAFRDTLYVVKGGTISEGKYKMIGSDRKMVCPDYYYMAILVYKESYKKVNSGYSAIAYWMEHKENTDAVSSKYAITIDELENRTGIDFFCNLPDDIENAVESNLDLTRWKLK